MTATDDFIAAAQNLAAALLAACSTPADAIRLIGLAATFQPAGTNSSSVIGQARAAAQTATGALFRRACISALVRAAVNYNPSSADDATSVRDFITCIIDAEIVAAGDVGDDNSYSALNDVRAAIVQLFNSRGAALAPLKQFTFNAQLPALTLANRIYRDPARADQLVSLADPPHPAFMPATFRALDE